MLELVTEVPDPDALLAMAPEELGAKLLFLTRLRASKGRLTNGMLHPGNYIGEIGSPGIGGAKYPPNSVAQVQLALSEAWAWLEAQGLIVPTPDGTNSRNGWKVLSRRAQAYENEGELRAFATARLLSKEMLHEKIATQVWIRFMRGDYDEAVLFAMKQVEIALREAVGEASESSGVRVARKAFQPVSGPLTDDQSEAGEQQAMGDLFAGALGVFKNPQSHRNVDIDDPAEAAAAVMLASHLLRIIDRRRASLS